MNEIRRNDTFGLVPTVPKEFRDAVEKSIFFLFDNLNTYGKQPTCNVLDAWILMLVSKKIEAYELGPAVQHFLGGKDLPTIGEVCDWIVSNREDKAIMEAIRRGVEESERIYTEELDRRMVERFGTANPSRDVLRQWIANLGAGEIRVSERTGLRKAPVIEFTQEELAASERKAQAIRELKRTASE
jgi:hypothetical protein